MDSIDIEQRIIAIEAKLDAVLAILSGERSGVQDAPPGGGPVSLPEYRVTSDPVQMQRYESYGDAGLFGNQVADPAMTPEILDLIRRGRKIQAIKLYRERTSIGLKAAKDAIDAVAKRMGW